MWNVPAMMLTSLSLATSHAADGVATSQICLRQSTITLEPGEAASILGAGSSGASLLVSGPRGQWIFVEYDNMPPPRDIDRLVRTTSRQKIYRKASLNGVYILYSDPRIMNGDRHLTASVSSMELDWTPLPRPRLTGGGHDMSVLNRIELGATRSCDLRWLPGSGLVRQP